MQPFLIDKFNFRKAYCYFSIHYKSLVRIAVNLLFPFRKCIKVSKVRALLDMEAMARNKYE